MPLAINTGMTIQSKNPAVSKIAKTAPKLIRALAKQRGIIGRPTGAVQFNPDDYIPDILTRLCCGESLAMICACNDMPSIRTVNTWMSSDDDFKTELDNAREIGVQTLTDAMMNIAAGDDLSTGLIERDRMMISVLKFIISKRDPAAISLRYSNLTFNITGGPTQTTVLDNGKDLNILPDFLARETPPEDK